MLKFNLPEYRMKKLLLLITLITLLAACNDTTEHGDANIHITGTIKGLKQGKLYIHQLRDTTLNALDSILFDGNSDFESHITLETPEMLYLILDRGHTNSTDNSLPFFAEPGTITINSSIDRFYTDAEIKGSQNHELYEQYLEIKSRYTGSNLELMKDSTEAKQANNNSRQDSISKQMDELLKRHYSVTANFAMNHADKEVGPYIALSEINGATIKYLDTIRKRMTADVAKSHYGKLLTNYVKERKAVETDSEH